MDRNYPRSNKCPRCGHAYVSRTHFLKCKHGTLVAWHGRNSSRSIKGHPASNILHASSRMAEIMPVNTARDAREAEREPEQQ